MKRAILTLAVAVPLGLALCAPARADRAAGLELAKKSGCLACHSIDKKVVGPPWMTVSKHYQGDKGAKERLVKKVTKGGKGNWTKITGGVPMPPYGPRVAHEDIEKLVEFVLSLAKDQ